MEMTTGPYLSDALMALASVSVVLWTGALVLKSALRIPSTWGIVGAMDLLQSSFIGAVLALGIPEEAYRPWAFVFGALYIVAYGVTFASFYPPLARLIPKSARAQYDAAGIGSRWWYVLSAVIFFAGLVAVYVRPDHSVAFIVSAAWMWIGMQIILTAYHAVDPRQGGPDTS